MKNVGVRAGDEVVQLYVREVVPREARALKDLRGIERPCAIDFQVGIGSWETDVNPSVTTNNTLLSGPS